VGRMGEAGALLGLREEKGGGGRGGLALGHARRPHKGGAKWASAEGWAARGKGGGETWPRWARRGCGS
jgi:hypothetical protein